MFRSLTLPLRAAAGAAALALAAIGPAGARADFVAYGYATQTISGLSITPGSGSLTATSGIATSTNDSATLTGFSGVANSDPLDAPQAYRGTPAGPPENYFPKYAAFPVASPLPSGTLPNGLTDGGGVLGMFSRGDVVIPSLAPTSNSSTVVAESFVNAAGKSGTGNGALTAVFSFTTSAATALTIAYNYANDAYVATSNGGAAAASFKFDITIKDAAGAIVFESTSPATNVSLGSPPNGLEIVRSGSESVTTSGLLANTNYTVIFSSDARTSVATVPEPTSMALVLIGGGLFVGAYARHRQLLRRVAE